MTIPGIHSDASPSTWAPSAASSAGFPGWGEDAPLDMSGLTDAGAAGLIGRFADGTMNRFLDTAAQVRYCTRPIRLSGRSSTFDASTGELLAVFDSATDTPLGTLYRPCGNRRAEVCPSCSRLYARDTFELIRAGAVGGKTVPAAVKNNPLLFVTLTAPSFGHVHGTRPHGGNPSGGRCRPRDRAQVCRHGRPVGCMKIHEPGDPAVGAPLCDDCHDWKTAAVWQYCAPELWRRTCEALKGTIARTLGGKGKRLAGLASLQFVKVAEYQARGLVHFHGLLRLDGPDGPGTPSPLTGTSLAELVEQVVPEVELSVPPVDADDTGRVLAWGRQLDVRRVRDGLRTDDPTRPLDPAQVAGYIAKYSTKSVGTDTGARRPHLARLRETVRDLGIRAVRDWATRPPCEGCAQGSTKKADHPGGCGSWFDYRRMVKWEHMLGFRGHFSTKSRRYSITLGALRRARQRWQQIAAESHRTGVPVDTRDLEARLLAQDDEETTLVVGSWQFIGTGWETGGDTTLALAAAARAREYEQWRAAQRRNTR